jgi:hypothetical protein
MLSTKARIQLIQYIIAYSILIRLIFGLALATRKIQTYVFRFKVHIRHFVCMAQAGKVGENRDESCKLMYR